MTDYFTSSSQWLVNVAQELVEDQQTLGSMDFNFRMIDYSRGYGRKDKMLSLKTTSSTL